jgi:hypothetical protein
MADREAEALPAGTPLYDYTITFEGFADGVVIEATDADHAYSELRDDIQLWPDGATGDELIISIIRGEKIGEI